MNSNFSQKLLPGMVVEVYGSFYIVFHRNKYVSCTLRGKFRKLLSETHNPIAVGDRVKFSYLDNNDGVIEELMPRRNKISRPTKWGQIKERIIASNVDQLVAIVSTKQPALKTGLIDRIILVAERENLRFVLCINKIDLINDGEINDIIAIYRKLRYPIVASSAETGAGIDELKSILKNKFSVFVGQSGVGKSSILNILQPGLNIRVREISNYSNKGKHTTSSVTAVPCDFGGFIADTPGFRDFGLWGIKKEEMGFLYREFRRYSDKCKFNPCSHIHEPECAVKDACHRGAISELRYDNYVRIYHSYDELEK